MHFTDTHRSIHTSFTIQRLSSCTIYNVYTFMYVRTKYYAFMHRVLRKNVYFWENLKFAILKITQPIKESLKSIWKIFIKPLALDCTVLYCIVLDIYLLHVTKRHHGRDCKIYFFSLAPHVCSWCIVFAVYKQ